MEDWIEELEPLADPELNRISYSLIGAAMDVHRALGAGYHERIYGNAMAIALEKRGVRFAREYAFDVFYEGQNVGEGRVDFFVEDRIVVEIKAVETLQSVHVSQVLSYLKATGRRLGILINFNTRYLKDGVRRIAL